ncbi:hypothetical protein Nepgr_033511 [Nepenthes gracilis]|uniref:Uncharacterized protein n=1 Tax=Nepenthes gracilis TaxID=150966 RepID=A0AAD3TMQ9_NEPGR|nr:hypothetical protein Nepgr_033511 [Nepenthes gracilis]
MVLIPYCIAAASVYFAPRDGRHDNAWLGGLRLECSFLSGLQNSMLEFLLNQKVVALLSSPHCCCPGVSSYALSLFDAECQIGFSDWLGDLARHDVWWQYALLGWPIAGMGMWFDVGSALRLLHKKLACKVLSSFG